MTLINVTQPAFLHHRERQCHESRRGVNFMAAKWANTKKKKEDHPVFVLSTPHWLGSRPSLARQTKFFSGEVIGDQALDKFRKKRILLLCVICSWIPLLFESQRTHAELSPQHYPTYALQHIRRGVVINISVLLICIIFLFLSIILAESINCKVRPKDWN